MLHIHNESLRAGRFECRTCVVARDFLFSTSVQNFPRVQTASCKMDTKTFSLGQSDRGLALTHQLPLVPRLRLCGAVLLFLCACITCNRETFTFTTLINIKNIRNSKVDVCGIPGFILLVNIVILNILANSVFQSCFVAIVT
jgi:hypothetical protein